MYAIIGVGTALTGHFMPGFMINSLEIACMFFETKQAADEYIFKIPWMIRHENDDVVYADGTEDLIMYEIPDELYDQPVPPYLLTTLSQKIIFNAPENLTYGKATGLHFFQYYDDRIDSVTYYFLRKIQPGETLSGFGGISVGRRR
ncbi:MAG: hypothetical protein PVF36_07155 [Desulfobacterales bacterium]